MATTYKSKVDLWLVPMVALPALSAAALFIAGLALARLDLLGIGVGIAVFYGVLLALIALPLSYTIDDGLHVRSGRLLRVDIPWDRLVSAELSNNPISSPALSLQRIAIAYVKADGKQARVLISPVDRLAFLRDLAAASPRHRLDGERLVAKSS